MRLKWSGVASSRIRIILLGLFVFGGCGTDRRVPAGFRSHLSPIRKPWVAESHSSFPRFLEKPYFRWWYRTHDSKRYGTKYLVFDLKSGSLLYEVEQYYSGRDIPVDSVDVLSMREYVQFTYFYQDLRNDSSGGPVHVGPPNTVIASCWRGIGDSMIPENISVEDAVRLVKMWGFSIEIQSEGKDNCFSEAMP